MGAVHRVKAAPKISLKISNFETSFRPLTNPDFLRPSLLTIFWPGLDFEYSVPNDRIVWKK